MGHEFAWNVIEFIIGLALIGLVICLFRLALNRRKAWAARGVAGATAIEYGLIAALIAVASIVALEVINIPVASVLTPGHYKAGCERDKQVGKALTSGCARVLGVKPGNGSGN